MTESLIDRALGLAPGPVEGTLRMAGAVGADVLESVLALSPDHDDYPDDPFAARDPEYIRRTLPALQTLSRGYFRGEVRGLENIPKTKPVLLVGNHSGGTLIADTFVFSEAFYRHFGPERRFHQLAHDLVFKLPGLRAMLSRLPGEHATRARAALRSARLPRRRSRDLPALVGVQPDRLRRAHGLCQAGARDRHADRPRGGDRRPGDRPLPRSRRAPRLGTTARPAVSPQGRAPADRSTVGDHRA